MVECILLFLLLRRSLRQMHAAKVLRVRIPLAAGHFDGNETRQALGMLRSSQGRIFASDRDLGGWDGILRYAGPRAAQVRFHGLHVVIMPPATLGFRKIALRGRESRPSAAAAYVRKRLRPVAVALAVLAIPLRIRIPAVALRLLLLLLLLLLLVLLLLPSTRLSAPWPGLAVERGRGVVRAALLVLAPGLVVLGDGPNDAAESLCSSGSGRGRKAGNSFSFYFHVWERGKGKGGCVQ
jgi:hypothetical protein